MSIYKKRDLEEFVGNDGSIIDGNETSHGYTEIETGPVHKPQGDTSQYEKGISTTTDRAARYKQNIPWFAVYSNTSSGGRATTVNETNKIIDINELIVKKKAKDNEIINKDDNPKLNRIIDKIDDSDFTENELNKLKELILNKIKNA